MVKNKTFKNLAIIGPPVLLILIGIATYIFVLKIIDPEPNTISAIPNQPQSSESDTLNPTPTTINKIVTEVTMPSEAELSEWQTEADNGDKTWRLDPVSAAEQQAGNYGFLPGDQLNLVTDSQDADPNPPTQSATIIAIHGGEAYVLKMIQPKKIGTDGIWIIQSIEYQAQ